MPNLAAVLSNFCGACFIIFQCFIGKKKMSREENVVEINCCNSFCFQREFALVPATPDFFQKKKKKESVITVLFYTFSSFFCLYFWVFFGFAVINCTTIVQLSAFLDVFFLFWWFATLNYRDTSNSREYVSKQSRTCFKETSTHFKISGHVFLSTHIVQVGFTDQSFKNTHENTFCFLRYASVRHVKSLFTKIQKTIEYAKN